MSNLTSLSFEISIQWFFFTFLFPRFCYHSFLCYDTATTVTGCFKTFFDFYIVLGTLSLSFLAKFTTSASSSSFFSVQVISQIKGFVQGYYFSCLLNYSSNFLPCLSLKKIVLSTNALSDLMSNHLMRLMPKTWFREVFCFFRGILFLFYLSSQLV